jgi:hypothetical protein
MKKSFVASIDLGRGRLLISRGAGFQSDKKGGRDCAGMTL